MNTEQGLEVLAPSKIDGHNLKAIAYVADNNFSSLYGGFDCEIQHMVDWTRRKCWAEVTAIFV